MFKRILMLKKERERQKKFQKIQQEIVRILAVYDKKEVEQNGISHKTR